MTVEDSCVYGISSAVPDLEIGEHITRFCDGLTILTFHGRKGRVYWVVIKKTDRKYTWPEVPRFSKLDAEKLCQGLQSREIHKSVDFGHICLKFRIFLKYNLSTYNYTVIMFKMNALRVVNLL
jgi:FAD dependent monooxygenase